MSNKTEVEDSIDFSDVNEVKDEFDTDVERIPSRQDAEWTDYVMAEVTEEDTFSGMPKVDVLRRLVEKFVGHIAETDINLQYHFNPTDGKPIAIAIANVTIRSPDGYQEVYSGVGDATIYNTGDSFRKYLCAIAETRAKGRAYKEALMLQGIVTEEEVGFNERLAQQEDLADDTINSSQEALVRRLTKNNKAKIDGLIEKLFEKSIELEALTTSQAVQLIKELNNKT